jgi:hypothetical protein
MFVNTEYEIAVATMYFFIHIPKNSGILYKSTQYEITVVYMYVTLK